MCKFCIDSEEESAWLPTQIFTIKDKISLKSEFFNTTTTYNRNFVIDGTIDSHEKEIYIDIQSDGSDCTGQDQQHFWFTYKIKYCPMCGRRL